MIRELIFSDVDGTFLDEAGAVPFQAAALEGIGERWRVVFASSRTSADLVALREQVDWPDWAIAEDGGVLVAPSGEEEVIGLPVDEIIARVHGAGAWGTVEALRPSMSQRRRASVLLPRLVAEAPEYADFRAKALSAGLRCTGGGRWATLTGGSDKGRAASILMARLEAVRAAAIGNDANDEPLLRSASRPFVIRNVNGHHPRLAVIAGATLLQAPGPMGWMEMISALSSER